MDRWQTGGTLRCTRKKLLKVGLARGKFVVSVKQRKIQILKALVEQVLLEIGLFKHALILLHEKCLRDVAID